MDTTFSSSHFEMKPTEKVELYDSKGMVAYLTKDDKLVIIDSLRTINVLLKEYAEEAKTVADLIKDLDSCEGIERAQFVNYVR